MDFFKLVELFRRISKIILLISLITIPVFWKFAGITATATEVNIIFALLAFIILSFWFVPSGFSGILANLGEIVEKNYDHGQYLIIPFISDVRLLDARTINKALDDKTLNAEGIEVTISYTVQYTIKPEYSYIIFIEMGGAGYFNNYLKPWIDSAINTVITTLSNLEVLHNREVLKDILSKRAQDEVDIKSSLASKKYVDGQHTIDKYGVDMTEVVEIDDGNGNKEHVRILKMIPQGFTTTGYREVEDPDDPDKTISVPVPVFLPDVEKVDGESLFQYVKIVINDVRLREDIEKALSEKAALKIAIQTAKLEAERKRQQAQGEADAKRINTDATVYDIERRGQALADNPSVTKQTVAENFPKVVGGDVMAQITDSILKDD